VFEKKKPSQNIDLQGFISLKWWCGARANIPSLFFFFGNIRIF